MGQGAATARGGLRRPSRQPRPRASRLPAPTARPSRPSRSPPRRAGTRARAPSPSLLWRAPATEPRGAPADAPTDGQGGGQVLSPVVRRLLAEHDLDPSQIRGTGAGDRITRADVLAVIDARSGAGDAPARPAPAAPTTAPPPAAPAAPTPPPSRPPVATAPTGDARRSDPLLQHPPADGRAHGPVEGHLGPHPGGRRGRLRSGRPGATGRARAVQDPGGHLAHVPPVRRPGDDRGSAGPSPPQRVGGRRRSGRPPRRAPRDRRGSRLGGPDRARSSTMPTASGCPLWRGRLPTSPAGRASASSAPTTSRAERSRSPTRAPSGR